MHSHDVPPIMSILLTGNVGFWLSLLSGSRCGRWSQTSSSLSSPTCQGFGNKGQIREPRTDGSHLGPGAALFTRAPGLVTAAFMRRGNFKTWFWGYLCRNLRAGGRSGRRFIADLGFHAARERTLKMVVWNFYLEKAIDYFLSAAGNSVTLTTTYL